MEELTVRMSNDLEGNFAEMLTWAQAKRDLYKNLVYTEDKVAEAKKDRAALNKQKTEINDRRIAIKNKYMEEYNIFEGKVKEVTNTLQEAIDSIDTQTKAFQAKADEEKKIAIGTYWNTMVNQMFDGAVEIPVSKVWKKEFLNKGYTETKWKNELDERAKIIRAELGTISHFEEDQRDYILAAYLNTLNLSESITAWDNLKQREADAAKMRAQMEEERKRKEEQKKKVVETPVAPVTPAVPKAHYMTVRCEGSEELLHELSEKIRELTARGLIVTLIDTSKK